MPEKRDLSREQKLDELTRLIVGSPLVPEIEKILFKRHKQLITDDELDKLFDTFKDLDEKMRFAFSDAVRENPDILKEFKKKRKETEREFIKKHATERTGEEFKETEEALIKLNPTDEQE